jgi:mono/diheme cytochrome c family protein
MTPTRTRDRELRRQDLVSAITGEVAAPTLAVPGAPSTILHGLSGQTIGGVKYAALVPAIAGQLSDEEVAAVVSHERTSGGHQAPMVKPADVLARR